MTTKCLNNSLNLFTMLDNELFGDVSIEVFLHTLLLFFSAEDVFDCFTSMVDDYNNKYYFSDVQENLKELYDRLVKEEEGAMKGEEVNGKKYKQ